MSTIIHDEQRVTALIKEARAFVDATLAAAIECEDQCRAFARHREAQRRPFHPYASNVIRFPLERRLARVRSG